jgi:hypothetical protein
MTVKPRMFTTEKTARIVVVTPDLAENWLSFNTSNRKQSELNRYRLGKAMIVGEFQFNGDAIRWTKDGVLADGQHRLEEVVATKSRIETVVVWGIEPEATITIDRNKRRTLRDHLDRNGERNSKELPTVLNLAVEWARGDRFTIGHQSGANNPSYEEADEFLTGNPNIRLSVEFATQQPRARKVFNLAHLALLHWIFSGIGGADADEFLERVISGDHRREDDPEWKLRERLIALRQEHADRPWVVIPLACKAWNYWRAGKSLRNLRIRTGGSNPESFPEPK